MHEVFQNNLIHSLTTFTKSYLYEQTPVMFLAEQVFGKRSITKRAGLGTGSFFCPDKTLLT
jgi:hypothetical protein